MSDVLVKGELGRLAHVQSSDVRKAIEEQTYEELQKTANTVFNRVNKRIRNIEREVHRPQAKIISPAYNALAKERGRAPRFGTSGTYNDLASLRKEYAKAVAFDEMETSSIAGARAYTQNIMSVFNGKKIPRDTIGYIFDILHGLHERVPDKIYASMLKYSDYLETVAEIAENRDFSTMNTDAESLDADIQRAVEELTNKMTSDINDDIDSFKRGLNRLF